MPDPLSSVSRHAKQGIENGSVVSAYARNIEYRNIHVRQQAPLRQSIVLALLANCHFMLCIGRPSNLEVKCYSQHIWAAADTDRVSMAKGQSTRAKARLAGGRRARRRELLNVVLVSWPLFVRSYNLVAGG
jgi:hypothetical protein